MAGSDDLTVLKEAMSTPHEKRGGVEVKISFAELAKYKVNVRSFHPNKQFEPRGLRFHGDNRGFSDKESYFGDEDPSLVTSRIWQRYVLDLGIKKTGDLKKNTVAELEQESNPSKGGPGLWGAAGGEDRYLKKEHKPRGRLEASQVNIPHGGQKEVEYKSWYGGENHAFRMSSAAQATTGMTFVPTLDAFQDLFIRIERVDLYMDIVSVGYGDGFPNCEAFIKDAAGNKLMLGTHVRYGVPVTHLAGEQKRFMWGNAIRVQIDAEGNFGDKLWVFGQALGGPTGLRDDYVYLASGEVCKTGAKPKFETGGPWGVGRLSGAFDTFTWDCSKPDSIGLKKRPQPLYLSGFVDPETVKAELQKTWASPPVEKTTRTAWNKSHLHRDPNAGRAPDAYDVSASKWKD
jgi:hypothetical protein